MPKPSKMSSSPPVGLVKKRPSLSLSKKRKRESDQIEIEKEVKEQIVLPPPKKIKEDVLTAPKRKSDIRVNEGNIFKSEDSSASFTCEHCQRHFSSTHTYEYHIFFCMAGGLIENEKKMEELLTKGRKLEEARIKSRKEAFEASKKTRIEVEAEASKGTETIKHEKADSDNLTIESQEKGEKSKGTNGVLTPQSQAEAPSMELKQGDGLITNRRSDRDRKKIIVKRFYCFKCTDKFMSKMDRNQHTKYIHEMERKFPCGFCDLRYNSEMKLKRHIKVHEEELNKC